jgi:hypothetical protein
MGGGWHTPMVRGIYGVSLWKYISKGWAPFSKFIEFEVGDGTKIRFWSDVWCGAEPLMVSFPELYRISRDKATFVANHLRVRLGAVHWEMDFIRLTQDWEMVSVSRFLDLLYSSLIKGQGEDKICWKQASSKFFQVRFFIVFCL